jgi:hypothetical protein
VGVGTYYGFDLMCLDGRDLTGLPLAERKAQQDVQQAESEARKAKLEKEEADKDAMREASTNADSRTMIRRRAHGSGSPRRRSGRSLNSETTTKPEANYSTAGAATAPLPPRSPKSPLLASPARPVSGSMILAVHCEVFGP